MSALTGVKRDYRAVSYALCSAVLGLLLMRIIVYFVPSGDTYGASIASSALFTLPVQLIFFLALPYLIYRFYGKRTFKGILEYSSAGKFKSYYLLAIPLGVCVWVLTIGISSVWSALLELTGYNYVSSTPAMPAKFSFGFFIAEAVMTAVLPAVCEEFIMRGGFLTTAKRTFNTVGCVVLCGIAFGLFHQNIRQVFYTALFGALAAYMTLKLRSIYPAMIMHFTNNFCSVYFDYAKNYRWAIGGRFFDMLGSMANNVPWALALVYLSVAVIGGGMVFLMLYFKERKIVEDKIEVIKDSAFDVTNKRVVLMGRLDEQRINDLEMEKEVYGAGYKEQKFKPSLRDVMIIAALCTVTVLTTVFTFVWGFFY